VLAFLALHTVTHKQCAEKHTDKNSCPQAEETISDPFTWSVTSWFTGMLVLFTAILAGGTFKLWQSTDDLVLGAEENAQRQLRAYVYPECVTAKLTQGIRAIDLQVRNWGQTPSYKTRIDLKVFVAPYPFDESKIPTTTNQITVPTRSTTTIAPGSYAQIRSDWFPPVVDDNTWILSMRFAFWLVGRIDYIDAFQEPQTTFVRMFSSGKNRANGTFIIDLEGNDST
jgi:hypothetical protein